MANVLLGHGASGTAASMRPWVSELAKHGIPAIALNLPRGNADRAVDVFRAASSIDPAAAVGGHSFGGRMASLLAAERDVPALVLLSYPLHRPGHPEALRTGHWKDIICPVLILSGEGDPFARLALLRREVRKLRHAELVTYPGAGHGLIPVIADATTRIATFLEAARGPGAVNP